MRLKSSIVLALFCALVLAPQASAHDLLIEIEPAPGDVIAENSFEARLTFNNPLLVVSGESNARLATKPTGETDWTEHEVLISDRTLTAQIELTQPGEYDLRWSVVSSDGHPISGESNFILEVEISPDPLTDNEENLIAPSPPSAPADSERSLVGFYIGLAMVVLGVIFAPIGLIIRRRAKNS